MVSQIKCGSETRRNAVKKHPKLNGIDFIEIIPSNSIEAEPEDDDEVKDKNIPSPILLVYCFKKIDDIDANNIVIVGGVRIKNIGVESIKTGDDIKKIDKYKEHLNISDNDIDRIIVIYPSSNGDFSPYTLKLIDPTERGPEFHHKGFDKFLSEIKFSFNIECLDDFDCITTAHCPVNLITEPVIDYMSKDYSSFRKLMFDRLSTTLPDWQERNPADMGNVLVELFAYVGDHLSYFQDSVATEAYLGTANKRISLKRHARLLDYYVSEGCNARAWVFFEVNEDYAGTIKLPAKTRLVTKGIRDGRHEEDSENLFITEEQFKDSLANGAEPFETMYDISLNQSLNKIYFYTWGDTKCCLPKGATSASLLNNKNKLDGLIKVGDILLFEEVLFSNKGDRLEHLETGVSPCQIIRVTKVTHTVDELTDPKTPIMDISWSQEDALPFTLCLWDLETVDDMGKKVVSPSSVVRGNIVLADHGCTYPLSPTEYEDLGSPTENTNFYPSIGLKPLTHIRPFNPSLPAAFAIENAHNVTSAIDIYEWDKGDAKTVPPRNNWSAKTDLFLSDKFDSHFVVEVDNNGNTYVRFGDDKHGSKPLESSFFRARYRIGNGKNGNVGAKTITQILNSELDLENKIVRMYNPIDAIGGQEPESLEDIRQSAPFAFRTQERAVTEQDYVDVLLRHPDVDRAFAMIRWTGSWYTVFITIDRLGGKEVDDEFKSEIYHFLDKYRLAGIDLHIQSPIYISLDMQMSVCVKPGYPRIEIKKELTELFSSKVLDNGNRGFFHPDNFTFGQSVPISKIYKIVMDVEGVHSVDITRFQRWKKGDNGEFEAGEIRMASNEIARLDNDPNFPENGTISFIMEGGL